MERSKDRAFTLVELLVVIGIIALLISILLPALGKARDQASRVRCLANMKQLHLAYMEYASKNRDQIPVGYTNGYKQMNYIIWNKGGFYQMFGLVWDAGIVKNPTIFYCPIRSDDWNAYDTQLNPWRPGLAGNTEEVRASYNTRPIAKWQGAWVVDEITNKPTMLPKLSKLKMKALFSDCVSDNNDLAASHKTGTNVVYSDGHGAWVPKGAFNDNLKNATPDFSLNSENNNLMYKMNPNGVVTGVWADLDAQAKVVLTGTGPGPR